jgi:glycosyltransferase involved in cell wall biosynthesis
VRILFLSGWFPHPPDNGARMRIYNLLRQLAREHEVSLLSFIRGPVSDSDRGAVESFCRVLATVPYHEFEPRKARALLGLFSSVPRSVLQTFSLQMEAEVQEAIRGNAFDLVIASEIGPAICTSPYMLGVKQVPWLVEDIELRMIWNKLQAQKNWAGRVRHSLTWWKQRQYTARVLRQAQGCTVASEQEREMVQRVVPGLGAVAVVPNGLDLGLYTGDWGTAVPNTLIFPGALTYEANLDAMAFFLSDVLPLIRSRHPDVTLRITGRTDGVPLHRLVLDEQVTLTGYVEDIRPVLAQSQVCVVPLLTGGGTRLKILEAMALGTPVVSTSRGAEGLDVTSKEELLIADEPAQFADAVLSLLVDQDLRDRLIVNGRRLVHARYGWDQIGEALDRFASQVAQAPTHRGAL